MIDLSIIIVNYNVKEFLLNLLDSIQRAKKNLKIETIVIDNNSDDGSIPVLKSKYPEVITIENKINVGFGAANNQGIEISSGKFILFLNPDTLVNDNTFTKLVSFLNGNDGVGLVGCKVLNPDGTLQLACRRSFPTPWVSLTKVIGFSKLFPKSKLFAKYNLTYLDENQSYEVDAISGSFMMMKREMYEKIGGFDTDFFMYGEDLDLCYRVQKAGKKVFYFSETEIIHYKGESTKRSKIDETKVFYDAMHLFVKKHFSSSFLVEVILQFGILFRKSLAFANVNKFIIIGILIDFLSFYFLIKVSENLYSNSNWPGFPEIFKPWVYIIPAIFQIVISVFFGAYKKNSLSVLKSFLSLCLGLLVITSSTFFLKQYAFSRVVVILTYGFAVIVFSIWRIILKFTFLKAGLSEESRTNAVIVGTNQIAISLALKLAENTSKPYKVLGLIGNDLKEIGSTINSLMIIGSLENFKKVIKDNHVDNVIFSSDSVEFDKVFSLVAECQGENINFMISGNELDYMVGKSNITHIESVPLLKVNYNISLFSHKIIKRTLDLVFSGFIMILIFPIGLLFSKLVSKSNLILNAILSLPKVFIGKLSLVGPQEQAGDTDLFLGKKGITGLWFLDNINKSDKLENRRLDLFYAKNQNIWLDLEIIGKTIAKYLITRRNNG